MAWQGETYVARGSVRGQRGGAGIPGLWVEAFDLDRLERVDRLGEARTDAEGAFRIEFRKTSFARSLSEALAKPGPNLVITVRADDGSLLHMTMPRTSASREEEFDIGLDLSAQGDASAPGEALRAAVQDPTGHWAGRLGLSSETDMHALRRQARHLSDEQLRRLDASERDALRSFASLSVAFPPRVAWVLARCGVPDLVALRDWPPARFRNALAVAGVSDADIDGEGRRFERLLALCSEDRPEDVVTGIDIDIQDRSVLSRSDWDELRRRDICTLEDWRSQREELALSSEGRAALDCYLRLMSLGLSPEVVDRYRLSGLTGARILVGLSEDDVARAALALRISPAELAAVVARARARVAGIEESVVRVVREDEIGESSWIEAAAGISLTPPADGFADYEASERFGYLAYLHHLAEQSGRAQDRSWADDILMGGGAQALEPVARVVVWNEALERARGETLDYDASFASRWRLLEACLQIGRMSPVDLARGDTNLELRLRAALVAPFAPPGRFTPTELAMLEDRAQQAARRQVEERLKADPEFAEATAGGLAAEVERRLALRLAPAMLDSEMLRYQVLRELDGRGDESLRIDCLVDPSLPARETTTRLDEAVVAMTIILDRGESGDRPLSFHDWRARRSALLWPHAGALSREGDVAFAAAADAPATWFEGSLAEVDRLLREAEDHPHRTSGTVATLLDKATRALAAATGNGATPGVKLLRARLGRLLLQRAAALSQTELAEARNEAATCCRAVLSVHLDPGFADRLGHGVAPVLLCNILGQATSRARREGDVAGLVRSVARVVEAQWTARLAGASGSEVAAACRSHAPAPGRMPREEALEKLVASLRSLGRAPIRPLDSIRARYEKLLDVAEILLPAVHAAAVEGPSQPSGCSPLELLLAAPMPSRDPVADYQKLGAVLQLEEIRGGSFADSGYRQAGGQDGIAAEIVRDATLQLSRCSMFVRRFDQLLSAGAALHERAVSTTARLAAEAGVPPSADHVAFEARAQQWVNILASAPECISSAGERLRSGLELSERESLCAMARRSAGMACVDQGLDAGALAEGRVAPARPALARGGISSLDGPWRLRKVLSFARLMPADLQAFREGSPVLAFRMLSRWFDEEFPKHCDRKIEGIGIALTVAGRRPAMAGVRLWNSGTAFAVSGPSLDERIIWRRPSLASLSCHSPSPESRRLEAPVDRTSFAGADLDSDWVLEISDDVDSVDPATVVDVELLVEYSAYGEYGQVWAGATRPRTVVRERLLSMRHHYPDAWEAIAGGATARFVTAEGDFGPRMEELAIVSVSLHPVHAARPFDGTGYLRLDGSRGSGESFTVQGRAEFVEGIASSRRQTEGGRHPWNAFVGASPLGTWEIALETHNAVPDIAPGELWDVVLAIAYTGIVRTYQD